jgi:hypothetical protein
MYFRWDEYVFDDNEVDVTYLSHQRMYSPRNMMTYIRSTLTVQGHFCETGGQAAIRTRILAMEDHFKNEWRTVGLYHDDHSRSAHVLDFDSSLNGIRLLTLDYPKEEGGEYATGRSYRMVFQADYATWSTLESQVYSWDETIRMVGAGGPAWEYIPQFVGPPVWHLIAMQTPQRFIQSGQSVGVTGYIQPPSPLWPDYEHGDRRIVDRETCQKYGRNTSLFYPTKWTYFYTLPLPVSTEGIAPIPTA